MKKITFLLLLCSLQFFGQTTTTIEQLYFKLSFEDNNNLKGTIDSIVSSNSQELSKEHALIYAILHPPFVKTIDSIKGFSPKLFDGIEELVDAYRTILEVETLPNVNVLERLTIPYAESKNLWLADLYFNLGSNYSSNKRYDEAISVFSTAIELIKPNDFNPSSIYNSRGNAYYQNAQRDFARNDFVSAYQERIKSGNIEKKYLTKDLWNIGVLFVSEGEYYEAIPYLKKSLEYMEEVDPSNPYLLSRYALLADCYFYNNDIKSAQIYAERGFALTNSTLKTHNAYLNGLIESSLSRVYNSLGNYEKAEYFAQRAYEGALKNYGDADSITSAFLIDLATVKAARGDHSTAQEYYEKAIVIARNTGRLYSVTAALNEYNFYLITNRKFERAQEYLDQEKALFIENKDTLSVKFYVNQLYRAQAKLGLDQITEAQSLLKSVSMGWEQFKGMEQNIRDTQTALVDLQIKQFKKTQNITQLIKAQNNLDQLIHLLVKSKNKYDSEKSKIFYGAEIIPSIEKSLELIYLKNTVKAEKQDFDYALRLMEINKNSALLDGLREKELAMQFQVDPKIIALKSAVQDSMIKLDNTFNQIQDSDKGDTEKLQVLTNQQLYFQTKLDSLSILVQQKYPEFHEVKSLELAENITFYQDRLLADDEMLVEYFLTPTDLYTLTLTKQDVNFVKKSINHLFEDQLNLLREKILNRAPLDKLLNTISPVILPQIPNGIKRLTFILDGMLTKIPMEILTFKNDYLIQSMPVRYGGSVQLLFEQTRQKDRTSTNNWLGYAGTYKDLPLPSNETEVDAISKLMEGVSRVDSLATKANFLEEGPKHDLLHLAVHGVLDHKNPMNNHLLFSNFNDEEEQTVKLTTQEIYGLDLSAKLAVLSACNTGNGTFSNGDGLMSLSRAFNYAGVTSTLTSLWNISDAQTSTLMIGFYRNLQNGMNKDTALQKAKLTYLKETDDEKLKHPYYWAGFIISGDVSRVSTPNYYTYALVAVIMLVLGISVFYWKRKLRKRTS
ncbi:hypothetical protein GCM10009117_09280 [Gangjinia marincola]|uniref:CHAT domain-containing protein n=1 Tax=Gangjinia marincola TaxID=578463 RepID=A0ABP3XRK8_9FLAO